MPTYEYRREDGSVFELRQGINDQPLETCPDTGQKVVRLISGGGGVVYKGDGWYVTDYKDNGPGGGSSSAGKAETSGSTTSDSASGSNGAADTSATKTSAAKSASD